jgi:hypothetical protein
MSTSPPRLVAKLPLRWVLVVPCVLQTVGAMVLVGYLSYRSGQQAIADLSQRLMHQVSDRIVQNLDQFYGSPQQRVQQNRAAIQLGVLDWQNQSLVERYFARQLAIYPNVSGLMMTTARQDFLQM